MLSRQYYTKKTIFVKDRLISNTFSGVWPLLRSLRARQSSVRYVYHLDLKLEK